jgi:methionyl aminopeptidase
VASAATAKANGNGKAAEADDSDEEEDEKGAGEGGADGAAKKKRKRKRKPKKAGGAGVLPTKQSDPPRVLLSNLYPSGEYPVGQEVEYRDENLYRTTNEEKRHLDRMNNDFLQEYRQGAEIHRQVRQWAQKNIKPGQSLTEIAEGIEDGVRALTGHPGLEEGDNIKGGVAFPEQGQCHEGRFRSSYQRKNCRQCVHNGI